MTPLPFAAELPPHLATLVLQLLDAWPEHQTYIRRSLDGAVDIPLCEELAGMIVRLAGDGLPGICIDYRWTCDRLLEEEIYFRRTGAYRLSSFAEAERHVYGRPDFMAPYLNGLLLSHLVWAHHRGIIGHYRDRHLPTSSGRHLEVGPGHGLLLHYAIRSGRFEAVHGWDVSPTSLEHTANALARLGSPAVTLEQCDILAAPTDAKCFDSIVASEVLEHLERPAEALSHLRDLLAPGGRLFVNVPVNSPAPDHIALFKTPEEVVELVAGVGLAVEDTAFFPVTGYSLERARRTGSTISCAVTARRA